MKLSINLSGGRSVDVDASGVLVGLAVVQGSNPHNVRMWAIESPYGVCAVVWGESMQDALDEACDHDRLKAFAVDDDDIEAPNNGDEERTKNGASVDRLGNYGEAFCLDDCSVSECEPLEKQPIKTAIAIAYHAGQGDTSCE